MIVLVTGGAGFIGSHLVEKLSLLGHDVFSLDNYFTGSEDNHVQGVTYIKGDTSDIFSLIQFVPDLVYHLGEYSRVEQSFDDIDLVFRFNKLGTYQVVNFCRINQCKLVYAGSSTKFGDGGLGRDQSPYAWTKASNTELISNYGRWYGLNYAITYFYNVYGPREICSGPYATLIALFINKVKSGLPLTVVLPGTQLRNFTHVYDIVSGLVLVGMHGKGDEFGIGSPEAYSVLEIASMFNQKIEYLPERAGNRMTANVHAAKTIALGWSPVHKISDYINDFVNKVNK
jgi:UDP-glucose 4-epimerase